ncbi:c-type cytochrome biogenesis protein CcmI [Agrobacterium salinitolerans]|uniref:C-type cytochrome biogenesis protein CcmI n=1 Tax=Agrobacterium salinitolerans TaxID=1183413 RepID=A0A9X3KSY5_9HYPH|nr:c-type cytochrome biogenesis protein CcmI [Agrobacterium salinitolerans]MCZ7854579.1 c-type cytochrome biogenesis protein CcmI [Agrobacterium salinitolerans]MCZ7939451.1 c-type cytochrome biogenesis protein CcmI [Agrobacterium salinitolerans]MCZ7975370.1 c-type cytochrome biogenesis protein CcmI [Agrobacterium salinitolerans]
MFWIVVAILTAAVAIVLMYPLMRKTEAPQTRRDGEVAVYRDQLAELDRERAAGLIGDTEADYARAEIGRRLLAAAEAEETPAKESRSRRHHLATSFITLLLPALGLCLYVWNGSPDTPDMPLEARLENPGNDMNMLVARAERHLAQNPEDGAGWDILAPIYFKMQRLGDAELAYRNALRIQGPSAERLTGLGETLVASNDGVVIEAARDAFAEADRLSPGNPRTRFYLALALEQSGKSEEAQSAFAALAAAAPAGAPWLPLVQEHIARTGGKAGTGPTAADVAAAKEMAPADRQAMIEGMVASLDAKLKDNPDDFEGWMRLMRAYSVLKNEAKAGEALRAGLQAFPPEGEEGRQLLALARELGVSAGPIRMNGQQDAAPQGVTQ